MEKALFSITCTTCRARLRVRSEEAIGGIHECPKCGSMVQVVPPEGWQPETSPAGRSAASDGTSAAVAEGAGAAAAAGAEAELSGPPLPGLSQTELVWRKWLLLGAAPAAGLVVVIGVCWVFFWPDRPRQPMSEVHGPAEPTRGKQPAPSDEPPEPAPPDSKQETVPEEADYPYSPGMDDYPRPDEQPPDTGTDVAELPADPPFQTQESDPEPQKPLPSEADASRQPSEDRNEPEPAEPGPEEPGEPPPDLPGERLPPIQVDIEARLADKIPEIRLREVPLAEAVGLLAEMSTLPITFDPEAAQQLGVTLHDPVTVELSKATVGQVLQEVVSSRGLAAVVEDGQMLLTFPADRRERLWTRHYTVSDLTGQDPAAVAEMAALVQRLVVPGSWLPHGGRGSIEADGGALAVIQTGVVHYEILTFCEKLRTARGKSLRSKLQDKSSPDRFALATRLDRARATLSRPVTANFHEPTPLIDVLAYLGKLTEADILVDRLALAAAGLSDRTTASVTAQKQPLGEALDELLGPLGLTYRAIDARTLQVTTRQAADARLELEFYPAADLLAGNRPATAVIGQIKSRLAAPTWNDVGGPGVLHLDGPSGCLIVLQSQPVQAAIERLLAEMRN